MISASKTEYHKRYPDNLVVFNANICTKEDGKVWYGDIDITKNEKLIKKLAANTNKTIYVLSEMDGRFNNETNPLLDKFIYKVDSSGVASVGDRFSNFYRTTKNVLKRKPEKES